MTISSPLGVLILATYLTTSAQAQSTTRVGQLEQPVRLELSAGYDDSRGTYGSHGDPGTVVMGAVAMRWSPITGWPGIRGTVAGIRRHSRDVTRYSASDSGATEREDRVLALTVSTDLSFRIWRDLTIGPSLGVGFSPYAHGEQTATHSGATSGTVPNSFENYARTEHGVIWSAGVAVRYRHLVIEKQVIGLLGAENAVTQGREYYPLSVGFRF